MESFLATDANNADEEDMDFFDDGSSDEDSSDEDSSDEDSEASVTEELLIILLAQSMKSKVVHLGEKMKMAERKNEMANARLVEGRIKNSFTAYKENKNALRAARSSDGYDTDSSDAVMLKRMMSRNLAIWEHNMSNDGS